VDALFMSARLEDFEANANVTALEKRTNIQDCIKVAAALNTYFKLRENVQAIGSNIANWVKGRANAHDCTVHSGTIDGVQWRFYAAGGKCGTTAQENTIRGAIDAFLEEHVGGVCHAMCLRMGKGILPQQCFCRMERQRQRHYSGSLRQLNLRHMFNSPTPP
jgi:hypothetical protein